MNKTANMLVIILTAMSVLVACVSAPPASETRKQAAKVVSVGEMASEVNFTVNGSTITGPSSSTAGWTRFLVENNGPEDNNLGLVQFTDGKGAADLTAHFEQKQTWPLPTWAVPKGGIANIGPGVNSNMTRNMVEGNYGMIRYVTNEIGASQPAKTPVFEFNVLAGQFSGVEPVPDAVIQITGIKYNVNPIRQAVDIGGLAIPIKVGKHVIKVENQTALPQEVQIVDIAGLKAPWDLEGWFKGSSHTGKAGTNEAGVGLHMGRVKLLPKISDDGVGPTSPPAGTAIGGILPIQPNDIVYISTDFKMGYIVLYSSLPDPETGKPNFLVGCQALSCGLVQEVEIRN